MHKRTLKRLAERLDRLEEQASQPDATAYCIDAIERHGQAGDLGPDFAAAYEVYAAVRQRLEAEGALPPDRYDRWKTEHRRILDWRRLDADAFRVPRIAGHDPVEIMLRALSEHFQKTQAAARAGQSAP